MQYYIKLKLGIDGFQEVGLFITSPGFWPAFTFQIQLTAQNSFKSRKQNVMFPKSFQTPK